MSSSMGPNWPSEPSSHSHNSSLSSIGIEQNDLVSQRQVEFFGNIQNNGTEERLHVITPESSSLPPQLYAPYDGPQYQSISPSVLNMPNHQLQSYGLESLSLTPDQFQDLPFPTDPNNGDTLHAASTRFYAASWRGANRQMEQAEIENSNPLSLPQDMYGTFGVFTPPEPSSTMNAVESVTPGPMVTQGQNATAQEASSRERKEQGKRAKDKERKKAERSNDKRAYERICELLEISMSPRNTLADRILIGVEAMAERLRVDSDMQRRVEETEAYAYFMNMEMTDLSGLSTRADITSSSNGEKFG